jgi:predicted transcriptional regulator
MPDFPAGLSMSKLSARLLISNGNVTSVVEKLVADGLVERQNDSLINVSTGLIGSYQQNSLVIISTFPDAE